MRVFIVSYTMDILDHKKSKNSTFLTGVMLKTAIFLAAIFAYEGKVVAQSDAQATMVDWAENAGDNYITAIEYVDKFDLVRGYQHWLKATQGEFAASVLAYPEVFKGAGAPVPIKNKKQFVESFHGPGTKGAAEEQQFLPAYYIDFRINQAEWNKRMADTSTIENKDFYKTVIINRKFFKEAPQLLRLYYYKDSEGVKASSMQTMPFALFGEAYRKIEKTLSNGDIDITEKTGALYVQPSIEIPVPPRKYFVAYGHRISHDDCPPGSHVGDGHQSQQCGKIIPLKSYHWVEDGKELTKKEREIYVKEEKILDESSDTIK